MPLIMFVSFSFNTYVNLPKKKNVSDDDCPKATSPSQQFPLFLIRIDNELASKAKDSLELYLLVEKIVWKLKLRIS
jgi:hypothetical protein